MKIIKPNVRLVQIPFNTINPHIAIDDIVNHVAYCARVCYNSNKDEDIYNTPKNKVFVNGLIKNGHFSMLRHASYYYFIPKDSSDYNVIKGKFLHYYNNPYFNYIINSDEERGPLGIYAATNGQFIYEHPILDVDIQEYMVTPLYFSTIKAAKCLLRYTFIVTTQIGTTRELNRVSPNNIAERSTRYVGIGKGGLKICEPFFYHTLPWYKKLLCILGWKCSEISYNIRKKMLKTNDASRGILPLETMSVAVYTYSISEWKHIIDLRYYENTGKAHPDAKIIAGKIKHILENSGYTM